MLTLRQTQCLDVMGVERWVRRRTAAELVATPVSGEAVLDEGTVASLEVLAVRVARCVSCELHRTRTQTVFGVGNGTADLLIVGEAPGAEEDRRGEPFVGRAGQLLNEMLRAIGLDRKSVYIANILKCRPPSNRDPRPEEVAHCSDFLTHQIELIQPQAMVAVGRIAAQNLLNSTQSIGRLRGDIHRFGDRQIPLIVTYHPAYLLRQPSEKRKSWQDLLAVKRLLEELR
ncbi:MAG: uracil-DNA glycosylase [Pseudomonadota bacterium]